MKDFLRKYVKLRNALSVGRIVMLLAYIALMYLNIELLTRNTRFENKSFEISSTILLIISFLYFLYIDTVIQKKQ